LFADILKTPAVQSLARRVEQGGALAFSGVAASAQPFFAALLQVVFPRRPVVVVAGNLKMQESFQQDLETWAQVAAGGLPPAARKDSTNRAPSAGFNVLFYPAWEILPHEGKLPHADVISERLETLIALSALSPLDSQPST